MCAPLALSENRGGQAVKLAAGREKLAIALISSRMYIITAHVIIAKICQPEAAGTGSGGGGEAFLRRKQR